MTSETSEPVAAEPEQADIVSEQADVAPEQASVEVELFRTDDYVPAGTMSILPLLRRFFEPLLGERLTDGTLFYLYFLRLEDTRRLDGAPEVINLRSSHGWVNVLIIRNGRLIYKHPHSVREIIGGPLQARLREQHPAEVHWGYGVRAPGLEGLALIRPAPQAPNQWRLTPQRARRTRRFQVTEIAEPDPPTASLADLGVDTETVGPDAPVGVVINLATFDQLTRHAPFSTEVEEGGFLIGTVHRAAAESGGYLVKLTGAVPAERTGASMMHFTFTGESFLRIGEQLDALGGAVQLVGWYHTHLFPATDTLGLSSIDVELHTSTFRKPAQVAGLVNIDDDTRVLRFYHADGQTMQPAPYWVVSD